MGYSPLPILPPTASAGRPKTAKRLTFIIECDCGWYCKTHAHRTAISQATMHLRIGPLFGWDHSNEDALELTIRDLAEVMGAGGTT